MSNIVAFSPQITHHISPSARPPLRLVDGAITTFSHARSALSMAGFGGASSKKQKKKGGAKVPKLKAKSQWDRFADLKKAQKVSVGVRIKGVDEWMEVGKVRSENDEYTEVAVARQRALIAEHSKRLYPVQIPANAVLEWGMMNGEEEWMEVEKSKGDDAPDGIEKKIGFEGVPDKATGFYCMFKDGKVVERASGGRGV